MYQNKRGVSPVVATVLLILLAVILAMFIFLWARNFLAEKVQKDLSPGQSAPIDEACKEVGFSTDVVLSNGKLNVSVENSKNIPIYGINLLSVKAGSKKIVGKASNENAVKAGKTYNFPGIANTAGLVAGDEVLVVPILLGTTQGNSIQYKEYICGEQYGVPTTVKV